MAKPNASLPYVLSSAQRQERGGEQNMPARFDEKAWLGALLVTTVLALRGRHSKLATVQAIELHHRSRSKLSTNSAKKQSNEKPYRAGHCLAGPPSCAAQAFNSFLKN